VQVGWLHPRRVPLVAASAVCVSLLVAAAPGQAHRAANPSLRITFTPAGSIAVTMPDGTPVGTSSGTPTLIPAGYYTLLFFGPGECINLPLFELRGPGVNINDDMLGGETDTHTLYANFVPNATYTWHSDRNEALVFSFRTSSDVAAGAGTATTSSASAGSSAQPTSQDIVGSAITPFRGTITAAVSAAGRVTFSYKGKSVSSLKAGRYTFAVSDRSSTSGFLLQNSPRRPVSVTGTAFLGKRSLAVTLTTGTWLVMPRVGRTAYSFVVRR
jgi:hypothetical protein